MVRFLKTIRKSGLKRHYIDDLCNDAYNENLVIAPYPFSNNCLSSLPSSKSKYFRPVLVWNPLLGLAGATISLAAYAAVLNPIALYAVRAAIEALLIDSKNDRLSLLSLDSSFVGQCSLLPALRSALRDREGCDWSLLVDLNPTHTVVRMIPMRSDVTQAGDIPSCCFYFSCSSYSSSSGQQNQYYYSSLAPCRD